MTRDELKKALSDAIDSVVTENVELGETEQDAICDLVGDIGDFIDTTQTAMDEEESTADDGSDKG